MKGRGKWLIFWTDCMTRPSPIKGFKCWYCIMKSWNVLRQKCMLCIVSMLKHARCQHICEVAESGRCTLSKCRKTSAHAHSSLVSFSSHILSCFAELCSSHWSSSTNASTHCIDKEWTWFFDRIYYTHLFSFQHDQALSTLKTTALSYQVWVEVDACC